MIRKSKKRLSDGNGKPMKPLTLFKFFATVKNATGKVESTGTADDAQLLKDIPLDGYFLGTQGEANRIALTHVEKLSPLYPAKTIIVKAEAMELVGPVMIQQIQGLIVENKMQNLVGFALAEDLAKYKAKEKLELNPDLAALTHQLVIEARQLVSTKLKATAAAAEQAEAGGLVCTDGQPIRAEKATAPKSCQEPCKNKEAVACKDPLCLGDCGCATIEKPAPAAEPPIRPDPDSQGYATYCESCGVPADQVEPVDVKPEEPVTSDAPVENLSDETIAGTFDPTNVAPISHSGAIAEL